MTKPKPPIDNFTIDCADFFAVTVQRAFPDVLLEEGANHQGRPVWRINLPPQSTLSKREIDDLAAKVQARIFMRHGRLVGYFISVPEE